MARIAPRQRFWRDALLRRMLAGADLLAASILCVALGLADDYPAAIVGIIFIPIWLVLAKLHGLYDRDHRSLRHLTVDELPVIFIWSLTGAAMLALALTFVPSVDLDLQTAIWEWLVVVASAFLLRGVMRYLWRRVTPPEKTLILGMGAAADATRHKLNVFTDMHVEVVGHRDHCTPDELRDSPAWLSAADRLIVALPAIDEELLGELVSACRRGETKLSVVPPARGVIGTAVQLHHVADLPVLEFHTWDVSRSTLLLKRSLDLLVSVLALILLAPAFLVMALALALDSKGGVFYVQRRAGMHGHPFRMYKFRTMVADAETLLPELVSFDQLERPMFKLVNDPRVTRVGRFLRRTSLDELPQLLNVLKGEMSLVGPRPEQVELVDRYEPDDRIRLLVKPGMTGPMQVFGRGTLTFEERLAIERDYIENLSIGRDLRTLAMTILAVVGGKGAF